MSKADVMTLQTLFHTCKVESYLNKKPKTLRRVALRRVALRRIALRSVAVYIKWTVRSSYRQMELEHGALTDRAKNVLVNGRSENEN